MNAVPTRLPKKRNRSNGPQKFFQEFYAYVRSLAEMCRQRSGGDRSNVVLNKLSQKTVDLKEHEQFPALETTNIYIYSKTKQIRMSKGAAKYFNYEFTSL